MEDNKDIENNSQHEEGDHPEYVHDIEKALKRLLVNREKRIETQIKDTQEEEKTNQEEQRARNVNIRIDEQTLEQRDDIWRFTKWLIGCSSFFIGIIIILQGFSVLGFNISSRVMEVLIGGYMAQVVAVLYIIAAKVFTNKNKNT